MGSEWVSWLGTSEVWGATLANPVVVGSFGALSGIYGLRKVVLAIRNRKKFGSFPFARNMNITAVYFCSLNASIFLLVFLLILQFLIALGQTFGSGSDRLHYYAEAYFPLSILLSIVILGLIGSVYVGVVRKVGFSDKDQQIKLMKRLKYLRKSLTDRGFGQFEIFGLPPLALLFNLGPTMIRMYV